MNQILRKMGLTGALGTSLVLGACSTTGGTQTWHMNSAESAQAAVGKVKVANEKDGNTKVKVEVDHLAPAASTAEEASSVYVVWITPKDGIPQNAGILKVDSNRKGEFKTKTPFKVFNVMVTLESTPSALLPSGSPLMDTRITMPT
jgi:hypothetical protein